MSTTEILVSEVMTAPVVPVTPNASVSDVRAIADAKSIHHFPIVADRRLVGIVCTCDLENSHPDAHVLGLAWRHVVTVTANSLASDAACLMKLYGVGSVVVVADDDGELRGIVTREDLVRASPELEQQLAELRCAVCGVRRHLRPGPNGICLCLRCQHEAQA